MNKDEVISNLEEMLSIANNETDYVYLSSRFSETLINAIVLIREAKKLKQAEYDKAYLEGYKAGYARAMLDYGLED